METNLQQRNTRRVCSRVGFALLGLAVFFWGGAQLLSWLLGRYWPAFYNWDMAAYAVSDVALYLLGLPVFLLILHFIPDGPADPKPARMKMTFEKILVIFIFCLGISYLLSMAAVIIQWITSELLKTPILETVLFNPASSGTDLLNNMINTDNMFQRIIFMTIIPPLGEEFIFRRCLFKKLRGGGDRVFIFMSGLSFGLLHMNFQQSCYTFLVGCVLGWVYCRTRQLVWCVLLHFMFNSISSIVLPLVYKRYIENEVFQMYIGLLVLALIAAAVVLFCIFQKQVYAELSPPYEAGWPHRPTMPYVKRNRRDRHQPAGIPVPIDGYPVHQKYTNSNISEDKHQKYARQNPSPVYQNTGVPGTQAQFAYSSFAAYNAWRNYVKEQRKWIPSAAAWCVKNLGMILYILATTAVIIYSLAIPIDLLDTATLLFPFH